MGKYCMGCMEQYPEDIVVCPYCGYIDGTKAEQALHMEPGTILHARYLIGKALGYGGFGITYIGWDALLEHKVAIKEYLPSEFSTRMPGVSQVTIYSGTKNEQFRDGLTRFVDEAKRLAKVNNVDGIVKIYDSFEENNTAYIVMEYLEGETLAQYLDRHKKVHPEKAISMLTPVLESLQRVHGYGIIHRDIAPDNLFITTDGQMKVIDFGAARFATTSHSRSLTVIIKPGYSPEEQYRSRAEQSGYTDVYAVGATLYKMITGVTPPDAFERYAMMEGKSKDILEPISKYCKEIDRDQENAILNAMNIRIEDRTQTMEDFLEELHSPDPVKRITGRIKRVDTLKWPLWLKISISAAAALTLVFGALFLTGVIGFDADLKTQIFVPEGMTRVPSVVNGTVEMAEARLTEANLLYTVVGKNYSAQIPANYVLEQDVAGGVIVQKSSMVNITVSGGEQTVVVPFVTNIPVEEARAILEEQGFQVKLTETYSATIAKGFVISQNIQAGQYVSANSLITLEVSKGQDPAAKKKNETITVPKLVGMTYEEALTVAEKLGFIIKLEERKSSSQYALNEIMQQTPAAGKTIRSGDTVSLVISLGEQKVTIPDVQYLTLADAQSALKSLGLSTSIKQTASDTVAAGLVISQTPTANVSVTPNSTVTLTVSTGSSTTVTQLSVPSVVGMDLDSAEQLLKNQGFLVTSQYTLGGAARAKEVVVQRPESGTKVNKGSTVTLYISVGLKKIAVSALPTKTSYMVGDTLDTSGLALETTYMDSATLTVDSGFTCSPTILSNAGTQTITVKYGDQTTSFTVQVKEDIPVVLQNISVASTPNRTTYEVGETLEISGLKLMGTYSDGTTGVISGRVSCKPTALSTEGTQEITVAAESKTTAFSVNVLNFYSYEISVDWIPGNEATTGYNENGEQVHWVLYVTARYRGPYVDTRYSNSISASSGISGDMDIEWEKAKNGGATGWTYGCRDFGFGEYHAGGATILPDDPSYAGTYSATITFGDLVKTVQFTLSYEGSYSTGRGWSVSNVSWS